MLKMFNSIQFQFQPENLVIKKITLMHLSLIHLIIANLSWLSKICWWYRMAHCLNFFIIIKYIQARRNIPPMLKEGNLKVNDSKAENFTIPQQHQNDPNWRKCKLFGIYHWDFWRHQTSKKSPTRTYESQGEDIIIVMVSVIVSKFDILSPLQNLYFCTTANWGL